jgi:hypothetical protein
MIAVLNGGGDIVAARNRAYELLGVCGRAIQADKTLRGAVRMATISTGNLTQDQTPKGAIATLMFDVACEAFTS